MVDIAMVEVGVEVGGDDSVEGTAFPACGSVVEYGFLLANEKPLAFEPAIHDVVMFFVFFGEEVEPPLQ